MASAKSLGIHVPVALDYLIRESLLPPNPDQTRYRWETYNDNTSNLGEEELLTTERCVVWSQGGVIQRVFRLDLEAQEITQALLTWFYVAGSIIEGPDGLSLNGTTEAINADGLLPHKIDNSATADKTPVRSRALVVLLQNQAHVYFLHGSSHIVDLPIEVERAFAAPRGLILQRCIQHKESGTLPPVGPRAPPNSFNISGEVSWPRPKSHSSISIKGATTTHCGYGSPPSTDEFAVSGGSVAANIMPRLFAMTDPLTELSPIVEFCPALEQLTLIPLERSEILLHVASLNERTSSTGKDSEQLMLALTMDQEKKCYSVWCGTYLDSATLDKWNLAEDVGRGPLSAQKRRSQSARLSFGAHTPSARSSMRLGNREGMTSTAASLTSLTDSKVSKGRMSSSFGPERSTQTDEELLVGPDISSPAKKSAANRRTSSMVARAELSVQEVNSYKDRVQNPNIIGSHSASRRVRRSFEDRNSLLGPHPGRVSDAVTEAANREEPNQAGSSQTMAPRESKTLENSQAGLRVGFQNPFDSLGQELIFVKAATIPLYSSAESPLGEHISTDYLKNIQVFTISEEDDAFHKVFILNRNHASLIEIDLMISREQAMSSTQSSGTTPRLPLNNPSGLVVDHCATRTLRDALDAVKIKDGGTSTLAVLHRNADQRVELCLLSDHNYCSDILFQDQSVRSGSGLSEKKLGINTVRLGNAVKLGDSNELRDTGRDHLASNSFHTESLSSTTEACQPRLANPGVLGEFDIVDSYGSHHRYQLQLRPRMTLIQKILHISQLSFKNSFPFRSLVSIWWEIHGSDSSWGSEDEWKSLVTALFTIVVPFLRNNAALPTGPISTSSQTYAAKASQRMAQSAAWNWMRSETKSDTRGGIPPGFLLQCVKAARDYVQCQYDTTQIRSRLATVNGVEEYARNLADLVLSLHVLREETKLNSNSARAVDNDTHTLVAILAQLGTWCGWASWTAQPGCYYALEDPTIATIDFDSSVMENFVVPPPSVDPPSVYAWLKRVTISYEPEPFPLSVVLSRHSSIGGTSRGRNAEASNLIPQLIAIAALIRYVGQRRESHDTSDKGILERYLTPNFLETLPESVATIVRSNVASWMAKSSHDFAHLSPMPLGPQDIGSLQQCHSANVENLDRYICTQFSGRDVRSIFSSTSEPSIRLDLRGPREILKVLFREDTRSSEPSMLLCPQLVPVAVIHPIPGCSEARFLEAQQNHAKLIYTRTMAIVSGQALLEYHCHKPLPTQKLEILLFNTSCRMQPSGITVNADRSNFVEEKVSWAFFHAGVQAGLRITKDAKDLDTSWLCLNKPAELGNRHAGLLLGLGLNGHLKRMAKWLAFKYMTPKHDMTSIGLLLGWSASYFGSMDSLITRVLSVHLESLLPAGSAELNLSPLVQTAATMGIGLLYYNSQHRRMSEKMLLEMERLEPEAQHGTGSGFKRNEGYRLAAGFALGFINLAKGKDLRPLRGLRIEERLVQLATAPRDVSVVNILDQATAGATIATALIFMKTHLKEVAQKIGIPQTARQFENVRPDILLLRVVAQNLIMWQDISPTPQWIWESMPGGLKLELGPLPFQPTGITSTVLDCIHTTTLSTRHLPLYNILAGLCWSIALKHAGSANHTARDCLVAYYDKVTLLLARTPSTFDERLTRNTLIRFQHLLITAAATVMAGTGDLLVLKRARVLHSTVDEWSTFGSHQASHMAMGALFLGQGRFTFGTSSLAVAALLCAFYPIYPIDVLDNRAHLQAFRHFWVFAAEARYILPRDSETSETIITPVEVCLRDGTHQTIMAPALLPDLATIARISTASDEYWQVTLDFENEPQHLAAFRKHHTILLKRKSLLTQHMSHFSVTLATRAEHKPTKCHEGDVFEWAFGLHTLQLFGISRTEARSIFPRGRAREERDKKRLFLIDEGKDPALDSEEAPPVNNLLNPWTTGIDDTLVMSQDIFALNRDRLAGLSILFEWSHEKQQRGERLGWDDWVSGEAVDALRAAIALRLSRTTTTSRP